MPDDLYNLTLAEFNLLMDGYKWRDEKELERLALQATWITAPHLKKPYTVEKLLGRKKAKRNEKATNPEKTKQVLGELGDLLGVRA